MIDNNVIKTDQIPENLISSLENRDVALWIRTLPRGLDRQMLLQFLGLPWKLIISESFDAGLFSELQESSNSADPMIRKRGFVQIVDSDPSRIVFPPRCLPVYLLNGRTSTRVSDFDSLLRRLTILEALRRASPREILVLSADEEPIPPDLEELWSSGYRTFLTFLSEKAVSSKDFSWPLSSDASVVTQLTIPTRTLIREFLNRYSSIYPENRVIIRLRDRHGAFHNIDVTELDEPERPILERFSLLEERSLGTLTPEELSEQDFITFFQNSQLSWRPYAAGLPWIRGEDCQKDLLSYLRKLDSGGAEEDCVVYIESEPGAGGTTLACALAWNCAREGYPVLIAKELPFVPDALPIINFLSRVHSTFEQSLYIDNDRHRQERDISRRYETPWIILFDGLHWQQRESELLRFKSEMEKAGRAVCILVVKDTLLSFPFLTGATFHKLTVLTHAIAMDNALALGEHLNKFLRLYGKQRSPRQWQAFYDEHTVRYTEGVAAFWVTLSFWIQGQYDLSESIQEWIYRAFKTNALDTPLRQAILRIAAMSSERLPLPEALLPNSPGKWPISHLLSDARSKLASLGLVRISSEGDKHWALVHDILGRFIINAFFYDYALRAELGFASAQDAEHLRFLLLKEVSHNVFLGEVAYRKIGEDFATSIFKIDPDHGHAGFLANWKEVLLALDEMPRPLRDTSRVFRHHSAISRRRIAKFDARLTNVTVDDKLSLLNRAIADINYALGFIDYQTGSEPDLNLLNSLANAYFDLADAEAEKGATDERLTELRRLANEATKRAYRESPTNSFVIETYVKNLLQTARGSSTGVMESCVEALGILYSALTSNEVAYRAAQLENLADQLVKLLFEKTPTEYREQELKTAVDVLVCAWRILAGGGPASRFTLSDLTEGDRIRVDLPPISHPLITGVSRFRFCSAMISQEQPWLCGCGKRSGLSTSA